jgi:hypothetical protein
MAGTCSTARLTAKGVDAAVTITSTNSSVAERAEHHAQEAERLLTGRLGIITNYVKAQVHATLAVYYTTRQSADK